MQCPKTETRAVSKRRLRVCDATVAVLKEVGEPTIMYGDEWLAHRVAERLGWEHDGPWTTRRLLAALSRTPGPLIKSLVQMPGDCCARGQAALCFALPEADISQVDARPT